MNGEELLEKIMVVVGGVIIDNCVGNIFDMFFVFDMWFFLLL